MKNSILLILILLLSLPINAQNYKFGKVSEEEVAQTEHPEHKEANAAVLYRKQEVYYELHKQTGLTLITQIHERIKIYNKEGFDWANKEIKVHKNSSTGEKVTSVKAYTYNLVDGKLREEKLDKRDIFEEETSRYRKTTKFTMPAVTESSVIEIEYTIRSPFITSLDAVPLQDVIPIDRLEVSLKIPEFFGFKIHYNPRSPLIIPIEQSQGSFTYNYTQSKRANLGMGETKFERKKVEYLLNEYSLEQDAIPPLKNENYIDYLKNYAAYIRLELQYTKYPNSPIENYSQSWEGVAKSIFNDSDLKKEIGITNYYKDDLDVLLNGKKQEEKVDLIYNYVRDNIKWNDYVGFRAEAGTRKAYKEGLGNTGDINLMLISMLRYAGFKTNPVLVSTRSHGIPLYPTREGFNYVVAGLELPNGVVLMDATDQNAGVGELPKRARNWQGRIIREDGSSGWLPLLPQIKAVNTNRFDLQVQDDFSIYGRVLNSYYGLHAKTFRDKYGKTNTDNYVEILEKDKGNIVISNVEIHNREDKGENVRQTYEFDLKNGIEVINSNIYIKPLIFGGMTENPFKENERNYPVIFDFPSVEKNTVNLMIPDGYEISSIPENFDTMLGEGAGQFIFKTTVAGKFLRVETIMDLNNIVYTSADYEMLKEFFAQMVEKQTEAIVLTKV
ncbi:MAG: transglutaminase domain-containing protein [Bacteroidota bacterium]